jgi:predicted alpha/beta superfamily hydrolase
MVSKVWLTAFLLTPAVLIAILMYTMTGPRLMNERPIGAGAGATGGANAIGELLAGNKATHNAARDASTPTVTTAASDQSAIGSAVSPTQPTEPKLVQPEELPQGFIIIVEDKAKRANDASPIYFAGSINGWNPGDAKFKLTSQSDGKWRFLMPPKPGGGLIEFKFTRGSWSLEELDENLNSIQNRYFPKVDISKLAPGEQPKVEFVIPAWGDMRAADPAIRARDPYRDLQVTGTVRRIQVRGGGGGAEDSFRDAIVWLPPGYDAPANATRAYPVLYLQDGQNAFEKMPETPAEWGVDETASRLIAAGDVTPMIIVAIPHSGERRISEYLPVSGAIDGATPGGDRYLDFVVDEVMPRVQRTFRVKTGPEHTAIGGSSMGAIVALHAVATRPQTFGVLLAESLPLTTGTAEAWRSYLDGMKALPKRAYVGGGGDEYGKDPALDARNKTYVQALQDLDARFAKVGLDKSRRLLVVSPEAEHNEKAWAARFGDALKFLFPPAMDDATK